MGRYIVLLLLLLLAGTLWWQRVWLTDKIAKLMNSELKVVSQVEGVAVRGIDVELIKATLVEMGFVAPGQITRYQPSGLQAGSVGVRRLQVVFTPEEQILGKTYGVGESVPYQSWGVNYNKTNTEGVEDVTIYLYVQESIVQTEEAANLAKRYQGLLLTAVWDLTHPKRAGDKELARFEGMSEYNKSKIQETWWRVEK